MNHCKARSVALHLRRPLDLAYLLQKRDIDGVLGDGACFMVALRLVTLP